MAHGLEADRSRIDVRTVDEVVAHGDVEQPVGEGGVGARGQLEVQIPQTRRRGAPRVDHDRRPPRAFWSSKCCIIGGIVSAGLPPTTRIRRAGQIGQRELGAAIDPEGTLGLATAAEAMQKRPL